MKSSLKQMSTFFGILSEEPLYSLAIREHKIPISLMHLHNECIDANKKLNVQNISPSSFIFRDPGHHRLFLLFLTFLPSHLGRTIHWVADAESTYLSRLLSQGKMLLENFSLEATFRIFRNGP
jgi:hypothetical protein